MTLDTITRAQLARELRLVDETGEVSERGVAALLRAPLARWGLSPRNSVLRFVREQLAAAGVGDDASSVTRVLDRLIALGECEDVSVGHERYLAPAPARWICTGNSSAVFLSALMPPEGVSLCEDPNPRDIAQRIKVGSDDDLARLHLAGVRQVSLEEWLQPLHYLRHAARRLRRPVRSDALALGDFWDVLAAALATEGLPLGADAELRAVTGAPGEFFGQYDAPKVAGRWTEDPPDGEWCGVRRGYGDAHWHPIVLRVEGHDRRALDLFNLDEWRWAVLARGRSRRSDERVLRFDRELRLTFPAPAQMSAAMDLVGLRIGPWSWELPEGAPDPWHLLP